MLNGNLIKLDVKRKVQLCLACLDYDFGTKLSVCLISVAYAEKHERVRYMFIGNF